MVRFLKFFFEKTPEIGIFKHTFRFPLFFDCKRPIGFYFLWVTLFWGWVYTFSPFKPWPCGEVGAGVWSVLLVLGYWDDVPTYCHRDTVVAGATTTCGVRQLSRPEFDCSKTPISNGQCWGDGAYSQDMIPERPAGRILYLLQNNRSVLAQDGSRVKIVMSCSGKWSTLAGERKKDVTITSIFQLPQLRSHSSGRLKRQLDGLLGFECRQAIGPPTHISSTNSSCLHCSAALRSPFHNTRTVVI